MDERVAAVGKDTLELRLHLVSADQNLNGWQTARMRGVVQMATDKAGWGKPLAAGHFHGIACFGSFNSYEAEVVEISMENDQPRVHRGVAAVGCWPVGQPSILHTHEQGAVVFALT